ncbi:MAG TPA: beta-glucosidase [Candidatus Limivivens merdigallinarum]|uniref:Beta-glucosidase n=1 Tax=Candidatus Limivivens merdigallinarum TaxID=2840859 RepID=A0A9D0ZY83_9FIRM|nr:beta-glucosidase [Candidatus Limivivens merdigallinarum]
MEGFPKGFRWGVTTASYQIEGGAKDGGRGETVWDRFSHIPGNVLHDDNGDIACDSYHHLEEDLDLLKELGVTSYRFSVAWSRIFPKGYGEANEEGVAYYDRLVDGLLERKIEPFLTLYHWDLPQALQDEGGWMNRKTAEHFEMYCSYLFRHFKGRVTHYMTLNEPWVVAFPGHYTGEMAPGIRDFSAALQAAHVLLLGHGLAIKAFREGGYPGEIGITLNLCPKEPLTDSREDCEAAIRHDGYANRWFLDPLFRGHYPEDMWRFYEEQGLSMPEVTEEDGRLVSQPVDFLGINYYNIDFTKEDKSVWPIQFKTGFSAGNAMTHYQMPITPDGLRKILVRVHKDYHPAKIYITENGASYQEHPDRNGEILDEARIDYLHTHLWKVGEAIGEGVPVAGYFVWTFLDDFEWNTGFENQFGLVYVDRKTMERTPKKSFSWYREVAASNGKRLWEK